MLAGLIVYTWQQSLLKSERLLRDQIKEQYDARLRDLQLTREQIDTTFKAAASTVLQQEAKQYREVAEQDLRQVKTEATGEIAAQKQAIQTEVADLNGKHAVGLSDAR